ncbi:FxsA family protein, partial [bacterium]|nr:FxsA family protein [bacterium]
MSKFKMFSKILYLFIAILGLDLFILIKIGQRIGLLEVIILIIFTSILGIYWAKLEGLKVINN